MARSRRLLIRANAAEEHLYSKAGSVIQLANHLRIRRELRADERNFETLSDLEKIERRVFEKIAAELDTAIDEALGNLDHAFLRQLSKAAKRLKEDRINQPLNATGATVLAFQYLEKELGRRPNKNEVRHRVDQWFREGGRPLITDRHWHRISTEDPFIAALFRED